MRVLSLRCLLSACAPQGCRPNRRAGLHATTNLTQREPSWQTIYPRLAPEFVSFFTHQEGRVAHQYPCPQHHLIYLFQAMSISQGPFAAASFFPTKRRASSTFRPSSSHAPLCHLAGGLGPPKCQKCSFQGKGTTQEGGVKGIRADTTARQVTRPRPLSVPLSNLAAAYNRAEM